MNGTIPEMMVSYAAEAVRLACDFNAKLDYSESSLQELEFILGRLQENLQENLPTLADSGVPVAKDPAQEIDTASRIWGGYFGETVRRLWGGDWGVETYPGTVAPVVSVDLGGAKLFPVMKVYRRLTRGDSENVWKFYLVVREKVSAGAGDQQ